MTANALSLDPVALELGSIAGRLEREVRLQVATLLAEAREEMATLRAGRAEFELSLQRAVAARLAELHDGPPGPPGEDGGAAEAPDDLAPIISKAIILLAEAPAIASPQPLPPVVNVTVPAPRTERTRVTKHDAAGRILEIERDVA